MTKFITVSEDNAKSGIYEFSKEVDIAKKAVFKISLFASERYILYINGEYICEGPCRGKNEDGIFKIDVKAPADVKKLLIMPDGKKYEFEDQDFSA